MNKVEGLKHLKKLGLKTCDYIIYNKNIELLNFDKNEKYVLRRSTKDNSATTSLGIDHDLTYKNLIKKVYDLKGKFDLIIQKEINIEYMGSVSRYYLNNNVYVLSIELFDSMSNRLKGKSCDYLINYYIDFDLITRGKIHNSKYITSVFHDIKNIPYEKYQMEFVVSSNEIYYTDFDKKEMVRCRALF